MLETFQYHSVETSLLTKGPVLDVGARDFQFATMCAERGHRVLALDPDPEIVVPYITNVEFMRVALVGKRSGSRSFMMREFVVTENPEGRYIKDLEQDEEKLGKPSAHPAGDIVEVRALDVEELMDLCNILEWDLVKLNCEGAEHEILATWPGPIARQIVVSFHEHHRPRGNKRIQEVVDHLLQWYAPIQHFEDKRYSGELNYWNSVFALKELVG